MMHGQKNIKLCIRWYGTEAN